jgi:hypothetical protein
VLGREVQQQRQVGAPRVDARARADGVAHRVDHASLMRSAAKLRLFSGARCAVTSTLSVCSGRTQSVQRGVRASVYRSSSLR